MRHCINSRLTRSILLASFVKFKVVKFCLTKYSYCSYFSLWRLFGHSVRHQTPKHHRIGQSRHWGVTMMSMYLYLASTKHTTRMDIWSSSWHAWSLEIACTPYREPLVICGTLSCLPWCTTQWATIVNTGQFHGQWWGGEPLGRIAWRYSACVSQNVPQRSLNDGFRANRQ